MRKLRGWKPKKWRPEYERMVMMSCAGLSNKMIAQETGYTPEHVSTILNLDQAEDLRTQVLNRMRSNALRSIPEELNIIAKKTVQRMKQLVESDEVFEKSPFAVVDRGMKVLEGLGHLGTKNQNPGINVAGNAVIALMPEKADSLAAAIQESNEVRRLHAAE